MKQLFVLLLCVVLGYGKASAQADSIVLLSIINDTAFAGTTAGPAGTVLPHFTIAGIGTITDGYTFTTFEPAYPSATSAFLRQIYKVVVNNTVVAAQLKTAFPLVFPYYEVQGPIILLGLHDVTAADQPVLFPNPATHTLYITKDAASHIQSIVATAADGRQSMINVSATASGIPLDQFTAGVYAFTICFNDRATQWQRVIINH
jgi:hypothetical protein